MSFVWELKMSKARSRSREFPNYTFIVCNNNSKGKHGRETKWGRRKRQRNKTAKSGIHGPGRNYYAKTLSESEPVPTKISNQTLGPTFVKLSADSWIGENSDKIYNIKYLFISLKSKWQKEVNCCIQNIMFWIWNLDFELRKKSNGVKWINWGQISKG